MLWGGVGRRALLAATSSAGSGLRSYCPVVPLRWASSGRQDEEERHKGGEAAGHQDDRRGKQGRGLPDPSEHCSLLLEGPPASFTTTH